MGIVFGKTGVAEPAYDLLLSRTPHSPNAIPYEIRKYGTRFAIETQFQSTNDGSGFRTLAGYIGVGTEPQNDGGTAVSMTAPVVTSDTNVGKSIAMTAPVVTESTTVETAMMKKMQFILPAEYDEPSKIPKPTDPNVIVKELKPEIGAVYTFSGRANDEIAKEKVTKLVDQLNEDGLNVDGEKAKETYRLWQFHPPFTIPFLRKNEVWLGLKQKEVDVLLKKHRGNDDEGQS